MSDENNVFGDGNEKDEGNPTSPPTETIQVSHRDWLSSVHLLILFFVAPNSMVDLTSFCI